MTSQEDELTGRGTHRKTNSQEDELGTAKPQLVLIVFLRPLVESSTNLIFLDTMPNLGEIQICRGIPINYQNKYKQYALIFAGNVLVLKYIMILFSNQNLNFSSLNSPLTLENTDPSVSPKFLRVFNK